MTPIIENRIFCFWTGTNQITERRLYGLEQIKINTECKVEFITPENILSWQLADYPFHPAYEFLSAVHKADYLRCYFMHHYGGGYCDIKPVYDSWRTAFELINNNKELWVVGCQESKPGDIANVDDKILYNNMQKRYKDMVCTCAFICRPNTIFTTQWINSVNVILDSKYELLKKYLSPSPRAMHQEDHNYALNWTEILGNIFHPLCYKYLNRISNILPKPDSSYYQ